MKNLGGNTGECPFHKIVGDLLPLSPRVGGKYTPIKNKLSAFTYKSLKKDLGDSLIIDDIFIEKVIKNPRFAILVNDISGVTKHLSREYYHHLLQGFKSSPDFSSFFEYNEYEVKDFGILSNLSGDDIGRNRNKKVIGDIRSIFYLDERVLKPGGIKELFIKNFKQIIENTKENDPKLYNRLVFYNILMRHVVLGKSEDPFRPGSNLSPIYGMVDHTLWYVERVRKNDIKTIKNNNIPEYFYEKAKTGSHYHASLLESVALDYMRNEKEDEIDMETLSYKHRIKAAFRQLNIVLSKKPDPRSFKFFNREKVKYNTNIKGMNSPMYVCPAIGDFEEYYKLVLGLVHAICVENKDLEIK